MIFKIVGTMWVPGSECLCNDRDYRYSVAQSGMLRSYASSIKLHKCSEDVRWNSTNSEYFSLARMRIIKL